VLGFADQILDAPEAFNAYLRAEIAANAALVKASGLKPQ
jgi:tripartite-type tricarboxylate transporter receptor subunit TctC